MATFGTRLRSAWNAFMNKDPTFEYSYDFGAVYGDRPDRVRLTRGNERSIVAIIYNRIAVDVSMINLKHARLDDNGNFKEEIDSKLNHCLTLSANIDQSSQAFIQDLCLSMFDEGCVAVVPVDTTVNLNQNDAFDIESMRVGKIVQWYPTYVRVRLYNDRTGQHEEITMPKSKVAIIENPFYAVMNEPNSTLQRLIRTLNYLDSLNSQTSSGKLDLIIQLPYVIKSESRQVQAENRRKKIEEQLVDSKYGIAYTDGTERITQLNRPVENTLWAQVKELTSMLYNQLGLSEAILNGTASEAEMINYFNNTINPILSCISLEYMRKFLTKTGITQRQAIYYYRDPFSLVPVSQIAEISDKFTRNEIATSNEIRGVIGWKPSDDPKANELRNSNLNQNNATQPMSPMGVGESGVPGDISGEATGGNSELTDMLTGILSKK